MPQDNGGTTAVCHVKALTRGELAKLVMSLQRMVGNCQSGSDFISAAWLAFARRSRA